MPDATYDILVSIRDKLDGLDKAVTGLKGMGKVVDELNEKGGILGEQFKSMLSALTAEKLLDKGIEVIKEAAFSASELALEIKHGAENMNMSARGFQVYRALVARTGGDFGSFTTAVQHMNQALSDARDIGSSAFAAFKAADLNPAEVEAMDLEHRISTVVQAIDKMKDGQLALGVQSEIFGSRTIPHLRGALSELAEDGYDKVADSMDKAGKILSDRAIEGLATKSIASKALKLVQMQVAEIEGHMMPRQVELQEPAAPPNADAGKRLLDQKQQVQTLTTLIGLYEKYESVIANDPTATQAEKNAALAEIYSKEIGLLQLLTALRDPTEKGAMPLDTLHGDDLQKRTKEVDEYRIALRQLQNQYDALKGPKTGALDRLKVGVSDMRSRAGNPDFLTAQEGFQAGTLQWIQSLGSEGQQVAAVVQSGIGGALGSVSSKLSGNDVQSWGEMWRNVLRSILQQMIQVTLQIQLMKAIMGAFGLNAPVTAGMAVPTFGGTLPTFSGAGSMAPSLSLGPGRALGGDVEVGRLYQVNEKRSIEMFTPSMPGRISPSGGVALAAGGRGRGGGAGIVIGDINLNVSTGVQETVRAEMVQMAPLLREMVPDAIRDAIARGQLEA